jgi:hypothetical protein
MLDALRRSFRRSRLASYSDFRRSFAPQALAQERAYAYQWRPAMIRTCDARHLPRAGSVSFKRGQQRISLPLYRADKIALLAADPATIEAWREADGASDVL